MIDFVRLQQTAAAYLKGAVLRPHNPHGLAAYGRARPN